MSGRRRLLARDGWAGGPQPYGWSCPDEQAVLAHVEHARQRGSTWRDIAAELNHAGRFKRNGKRWTAAELHRTSQRASRRPA